MCLDDDEYHDSWKPMLHAACFHVVPRPQPAPLPNGEIIVYSEAQIREYEERMRRMTDGKD